MRKRRRLLCEMRTMGSVLALGVGAALNQCAGICVTPDDNPIQRRRYIGVVVQRLDPLIV